MVSDIGHFNAQFPNILVPDSQDGIEDDEEEQDEEEKSDSTNSGMVWYKILDEVSELTREPWSSVWQMPIIDFFTYYSYYGWKMNMKKKLMEEMRRRSH